MEGGVGARYFRSLNELPRVGKILEKRARENKILAMAMRIGFESDFVGRGFFAMSGA